MILDDALCEIAAFLNLDAEALKAYAAEDTIGGFHPDAAQAAFPTGSLWRVEGQVLYALMRALQPSNALELGTLHGASTTHLLSAKLRNGHGRLRSVDWWAGAGSMVRSDLRDGWDIRHEEAVTYLKALDGTHIYSFAYEDCIHSESEVYAIVTALRPALCKGAVVVHHDSEHGDDGDQIRRALTKAGVAFKSWLIEPSDCGIAIWKAE